MILHGVQSVTRPSLGRKKKTEVAMPEENKKVVPKETTKKDPDKHEITRPLSDHLTQKDFDKPQSHYDYMFGKERGRKRKPKQGRARKR